MKKFYILVPLLLMVAFVVYYLSFSKSYQEAEARRAAEKARMEQVEVEKKQEAERIAKADAERRSAERAAEEARKDAERRQKWEAAGQALADETQKYNQEADRLAKEAADLEMQLLNLRNQKERAGREAFELARRVELARIAKRNAELEIQRMTEMVARRAAESAMTQVAATPPPQGRR
jgi:hypothetical protein